ncbi:hypothetical protein N8480_03535 [Flavobacteriaceae bacterium]|jgi:hypothetical protein|nr:hypothetical protein [Flavobacteriaceae bacterium]
MASINIKQQPMKKPYKILIGILIFVFTISILSDWKNFKAGLLGTPPIVKNKQALRKH